MSCGTCVSGRFLPWNGRRQRQPPRQRPEPAHQRSRRTFGLGQPPAPTAGACRGCRRAGPALRRWTSAERRKSKWPLASVPYAERECPRSPSRTQLPCGCGLQIVQVAAWWPRAQSQWQMAGIGIAFFAYYNHCRFKSKNKNGLRTGFHVGFHADFGGLLSARQNQGTPRKPQCQSFTRGKWPW